MRGLSEVLAALKKIMTGYHIGGIALSLAFLALKSTTGLCSLVFTECGLDYREHEIVLFLAIMVFYKNRKATSWMHCLSNTFLYCRVVNTFLFLRADLFAGIAYIFACLVHTVFFPEPVAVDSDNTLIFDDKDLYEQIQRNPRITWMIFFYTAWSPDCRHVAPVFAELSDRFNLPNFRFAKLDVGRWSGEANRFRINICPGSKQLPTISLFKEGREIDRRPAVRGGRALPFTFTKENCILAFDLSNLYEKCRTNLTKSEREKLANEQSKKND